MAIKILHDDFEIKGVPLEINTRINEKMVIGTSTSKSKH